MYACPVEYCDSYFGTRTDFKKHLKKQHRANDEVIITNMAASASKCSKELQNFVSNLRKAKSKAAIRDIAFPNGANVALYDNAARPRIDCTLSPSPLSQYLSLLSCKQSS